MTQRISKDEARFKKIVRGAIKKNFKKYMTQRKMVGRKGGDKVIIPLPEIELPKFIHGQNEGVGSGKGDKGDAVGKQGQDPGQGQAGDQPGEHSLEVEVSLEELTDILGEELELPRIEPRGKNEIDQIRERYIGVSKKGPESLRHTKRTFKEALKRQIVAEEYDPDNPIIIPIKEDKRYRAGSPIVEPDVNAVVISSMDVSGSMGTLQKEMVRTHAFWVDLWLKRNYKNLQRIYVVHDTQAKEVDEQTFYYTTESGGTLISPSYRLMNEIMEERFPPHEWNVYMFHYSDGDNWASEDTGECIKILKDQLLPVVNQFGYVQVESAYGSGDFSKKLLDDQISNEENLILTDIKDREDILTSIKKLLGKGN